LVLPVHLSSYFILFCRSKNYRGDGWHNSILSTEFALYPSVSTVFNTDMSSVSEFTKSAIALGYPGIMVFTVTDKSQPYLQNINPDH